MKKIVSLMVLASLCLALCACNKTEEMKAAEAAIKAIGEVTLNSADAIEAAEEAVDALSDEDKEKFKMHDELKQAKDKYNSLLEKEKVETLIKQIDELGEITLDSGEKVDAAEQKFKDLSSDAQKEVTNKGTLDKAINTLSTLRTAEKESIIAAKTPLFNINHDKVENITWYEHKSTPNYIDIRSYIIPYIGKSGNNYWICTRYNYTADEWVFWESMTILVDGTKYYKYVGSTNTIRDNDTEVWEYYDEALDSNIGMDNKDLQMLKAISESNETIIRFQGDEYHYDLYVTPTDKKIIADTLALYQALIW